MKSQLLPEPGCSRGGTDSGISDEVSQNPKNGPGELRRVILRFVDVGESTNLQDQVDFSPELQLWGVKLDT